ncbi:rubredoxin-like domain-containing protein [Sphaerochaeta sp.]|uniref:rubredoxin-like domain-containing protein n=1 Tax=Sphaerochaeta sp. TaxID=1972642 RepID=UPI002FC6EE33
MEEVMRELSAGELAALCTNLEKACAKQLRSLEAGLFAQLGAYYEQKRQGEEEHQYGELLALVNQDLAQSYEKAGSAATFSQDRGALRALVWGEKVSKLLKSLLARYEKQGDDLLEHTKVYVCEICGFIYVGDVPPAICPICKVPGFKIHPIEKEAV